MNIGRGVRRTPAALSSRMKKGYSTNDLFMVVIGYFGARIRAKNYFRYFRAKVDDKIEFAPYRLWD